MKIAYNGFLYEMATPTDNIMSKEYYHGVYKPSMAQYILENGIVPPAKKRSGYFAPVRGMVYLTPDIKYALYYAKGLDNKQHLIRYGFIFVVPGNELKDIYPDEDSIAKLMIDYVHLLYKEQDTKAGYITGVKPQDDVISSICERMFKLLDEAEILHLRFGPVKFYAGIGKKILKALTNEDIINIIEQGDAIAHKGFVKPSSVYVIDKRKLNDNKYGKNYKFSDYSELITLDKLRKRLNEGKYTDDIPLYQYGSNKT
jgi:hypothetical protein